MNNDNPITNCYYNNYNMNNNNYNDANINNFNNNEYNYYNDSNRNDNGEYLNNNNNNYINNMAIERFHMRNQTRFEQYQGKKLVSLDGLQSGVPTLTTSTLTPTTLRNIEQTFIELTSDPSESAPYQAGFVPPPAPSFVNFVDNSNDHNSMDSTDSDSQSQDSWHTQIMLEENSMATDTSSVGNSMPPSGSPNNFLNHVNGNSVTGQNENVRSKKNVGGRRPTKPSNLTPEEEEKRRVRRERNKLAAARCRKRRVDQTNDLLEKVEKLEKEKEAFKKQIEECNVLKDDLTFCLESHRSNCRRHHNNNNILNNNINNINNNNNSSNNIINTILVSNIGRSSPLDMKPIIVQDQFDAKIKDEPLDSLDSLGEDGPPSPKRIMLSQTIQSPMIPPPLQNLTTTLSNIPMLNTPTITVASPLLTTPTGFNTSFARIKTRPNSLNVPLTLKPSQVLLTNKGTIDCGIPISTPSNGVFNFDSLMDGGTGLTPVAGPLMPTNCSNHTNKHPLELVTPTSESSKLVSL